ncbi:uncharacterized protein LOC122650644 [Telopea speciosissima]|uniref:uncharacterized protein LOC122650644 n=1 Tax=Telopea speciosissima TaxID=54955 RepID=UPI001CC62DAA|nr:uncharacterized protein LOC122650644 [Telopea speciosissima]
MSQVPDICQHYSHSSHGTPFIECSLAISTWGIDIIGKMTPKASNRHKFILVAIDYFTKWVEAQSYAVLTTAKVEKFIKENIICRYELPHDLISNQGEHFLEKIDKFCAKFGIKRHWSITYSPQANGAVEVAHKNAKVILQKKADTHRDWADKLPYALWAYRTSI